MPESEVLSLELPTYDGKRRVISTITEAFEILYSSGVIENHAYVFDDPKEHATLVYHAKFLNPPVPSDPSDVKRPTDPKGLENFLYILFKRYLSDDQNAFSPISAIHVDASPQNWPENMTDEDTTDIQLRNTLKVSLLLNLRKEFSKELRKALRYRARGVSKRSMTYYRL